MQRGLAMEQPPWSLFRIGECGGCSEPTAVGSTRSRGEEFRRAHESSLAESRPLPVASSQLASRSLPGPSDANGELADFDCDDLGDTDEFETGGFAAPLCVTLRDQLKRSPQSLSQPAKPMSDVHRPRPDGDTGVCEEEDTDEFATTTSCSSTPSHTAAAPRAAPCSPPKSASAHLVGGAGAAGLGGSGSSAERQAQGVGSPGAGSPGLGSPGGLGGSFGSPGSHFGGGGGPGSRGQGPGLGPGGCHGHCCSSSDGLGAGPSEDGPGGLVPAMQWQGRCGFVVRLKPGTPDGPWLCHHFSVDGTHCVSGGLGMQHANRCAGVLHPINEESTPAEKMFSMGLPSPRRCMGLRRPGGDLRGGPVIVRCGRPLTVPTCTSDTCPFLAQGMCCPYATRVAASSAQRARAGAGYAGGSSAIAEEREATAASPFASRGGI
eukprot:TRINITY_DN38487_c0_g1_i1.p1 TRINITY_DN38487_c0_g1~~TRINITY_DN38487_c0_g1_i1.p1  ORF type:complete len:434 (+),score=77.57 TRINITY_DN38487_c0_g1_i1:181-1482(+)